MDSIYVVMGCCGEYSDSREWPVMAYASEKLAAQHVVDAERWWKDLAATLNGYDRAKQYKNPFDPEMQSDYTGTSYYYYKVPFKE